MDQIERIKYMEHNLKEASEAVAGLDRALEQYINVLPMLLELSEYYGSAEWFRDFEDDSAGRLPADLKRGVLSEDAVYNLLMENQRLLKMMKGI